MRTALANGGLLLAALLLAAAAVARPGPAPHPAAAPAVAVVTGADGVAVPVRPYRRIVSTAMTADAALLDCCEPERVAACSAYTRGPAAWRLGSVRRLPGLDDLEAIVALGPDLVLAADVGASAARVARLREAGLTVLVLGPMTGIAAYSGDLRLVAAALGVAERGGRAAAALRRRLAAVAAGLPPGAERPRALYLAPVSGMLFGGTAGTGYHDLLLAAGCQDAAAGRYRGWPQWSVEQVLDLAPAVLVTRAGAAAELRRLPGLDRLQARIVELDGDLLENPGPSILEAAEALFAAVHGGG